MSASEGWRRVTKHEPCPACKKPDWCAWTPDGNLKCERAADAPAGMELISASGGGALFGFPAASNWPTGTKCRRRERSKKTRSNLDWKSESERLQAALSDARLLELAGHLGVRADALRALGIGWATQDDLRRMHAGGSEWRGNYPEGAFTFPEVNGAGKIVGLALRAADGRKGSPSSRVGSHRGLVVPASLADLPDPVLIVEGASDVAAGLMLGLAAVGRPSNSGGAAHLAQLLGTREVLVLGERDQKPDGNWPGRKGAEQVAGALCTKWKRPVRWVLPPDEAKDLRAWIQDRMAKGVDPNDDSALRGLGQELKGLLTKDVEEPGPPAERRLSQAELLVRLAHDRYQLGCTPDGQPFAVERAGPHVALVFKGNGCALRAKLARDFRARHGSVPSGSALVDALNVLRGEALDLEPEQLNLRVARDGEAIIIDIGDTAGRAIRVDAGRWEILDRSPVLFRRTALIGSLPTPERGGNIEEIWEFLNVAESDRELLMGWIISVFIPGIPHPIPLFGGEKGSAKSSSARTLKALTDPSQAMLRSQPNDIDSWTVPVDAAWFSVFDNVSSIPPWWSDLLCKGVTGDGYPRRELYTADGVSVHAFQRVFLITSIDAGALRGDLGDRVLLIDFEVISAEKRRTESELEALFSERRGRILGGLLDMLVKVLKILPETRPARLPRMADFARVLAALDKALGTDALARYAEQEQRVADEVVEGDPIATALLAYLENSGGEWDGPAAELLRKLVPTPVPPGWPRSGRGMRSRLASIAPVLRTKGYEVLSPKRTDKKRHWIIRSSEAPRIGGESTAHNARPPEIGPEGLENGHCPSGGRGEEHWDRPTNRPTANRPRETAERDSGRLGGLGGRTATSLALAVATEDHGEVDWHGRTP